MTHANTHISGMTKLVLLSVLLAVLTLLSAVPAFAEYTLPRILCV